MRNLCQGGTISLKQLGKACEANKEDEEMGFFLHCTAVREMERGNEMKDSTEHVIWSFAAIMWVSEYDMMCRSIVILKKNKNTCLIL